MTHRPGTHGLARWLSKLGFASRAEAARLCRAGRVAVGGRVCRDPERRTDPRRERIAVDGRPVERAAPVYLALHKPLGVVTTRSDERGRRTVYDLLPPLETWVFPVGRLDADTAGLLLFTNDTGLGDALAGDRRRVEKRYEVLVAGVVTVEEAERLIEGVEIRVEGGRTYRTLPARCRILSQRPDPPESSLALTIREGRNRQVRRMIEALGHGVLALKRTRVGPIELRDLPAGASRPLDAREVRALRRLAAPPGVVPPRRRG